MVNVGLKTCEYPAHIPQRLFGRALPGPWLSKAGSRLLLVEPDSLGREAVEDATELHLSARCCAPCTYLHQNLPNAFAGGRFIARHQEGHGLVFSGRLQTQVSKSSLWESPQIGEDGSR